jgi:hypothetical protein
MPATDERPKWSKIETHCLYCTKQTPEVDDWDRDHDADEHDRLGDNCWCYNFCWDDCDTTDLDDLISELRAQLETVRAMALVSTLYCDCCDEGPPVLGLFSSAEMAQQVINRWDDAVRRADADGKRSSGCRIGDLVIADLIPDSLDPATDLVDKHHFLFPYLQETPDAE